MTKEKAISYLGMAVPIMALTVERFAEFGEAIRMAVQALEIAEYSCEGCRFFCSKPYYDGICKTCTRNYIDRYVKDGEEHD